MSAAKHSFNPEQFFNPEAMRPFMDACGYNPEALSKFQQEATEAARTMAQCQADFARESMEDLTTFWRNWMSSGPNMQEKMEIQAQAARDSFAKAVAHNKELTAIMQKTQEKVVNQFSKAVREATPKPAKAKN